MTDCFGGNFGTIRVKDVSFPLVRSFRSSGHNINSIVVSIAGGCYWQQKVRKTKKEERAQTPWNKYHFLKKI